MVDAMLQMDPNKVDQILSNGHSWAVDHITTSKDDVEEVGNFLMHRDEPSHMNSDVYNSQQPQFVPVMLDTPSKMKGFIREIIRKVKGGYRLYSHKGKNLGTFPSMKKAKDHEQTVNYFKNKK